MGKDAIESIRSGDRLQQAFFLNRHSLLYSYRFTSELSEIFKSRDFDLKTSRKENILRIAQKIHEEDYNEFGE